MDDRHALTDGQWAKLAPLLPPERFGTWETVYSRFRRWQQAGVWDRVLTALQADADARGDLDWSLHFVDGTIVRVHPDAGGAQKGGPLAPTTKPSAAARAALPPRSTCAPTAPGSRSPGS
jgi:transposase